MNRRCPLMFVVAACLAGCGSPHQGKPQKEDPDERASEIPNAGPVEEPGDIGVLKKKGAIFHRVDPMSWSVDLSRFEMTDADLGRMTKLRDVRWIRIESISISDEGLAGLAELERLEDLFLSNLSGITDRGVDKLADIRTLEKLTLHGLKVTDQGFTRFGQLRRLKELDLAGLSISDEALDDLRSLSHLESLDLSKTRITDSGCVALAVLPALKSLDLRDTAIGGEGLRDLSKSKSLESLRLDRTSIDDRALSYIPEFERLGWLSIWNTGVSDEGLKHLRKAKLKYLTMLFSKNDRITDVGLRSLQDIETLKEFRFELHGTRVTAEGIARLQNAMPQLKITMGLKK